RKRAYCLKIQPATGSFARNLIYSTKPVVSQNAEFPFANSSLTFAIPTYLKNKNLLRILLFSQPL
ncbi:hypothetical protein, partial [Klebsiella pneumoniae]|uniref:hypothetical protein n=1 Tax=Klebsiella pneumoniae TaxID=573 RepID=UPI001C4ECB12